MCYFCNSDGIIYWTPNVYCCIFFVYLFVWFFLKLYPAVYFFGYILFFYYLLCLFIEIHVKTVLAPVIRLLLRLYGGYYICTRSIITEFENVYMHVLHTISWIHLYQANIWTCFLNSFRYTLFKKGKNSSYSFRYLTMVMM